jgi:hypothetical protein
MDDKLPSVKEAQEDLESALLRLAREQKAVALAKAALAGAKAREIANPLARTA